MPSERIGFAGLGLMGHGMARNIITKGFPLAGLAHRKREAIDDLKSLGATEVTTAKALAEASDIIVLCVTGSPQVEALLADIAAAGKPLLVIDCSTSDPSSTLRLAADLATKNITLVDAPLSRTPKDAWAGTLDVMVGGAPDAVARARPVLETFAGKIVETGPVGSGHTMKLLNNFVSLGYGAIYAEALMLGAKAGIGAEVFDRVIRGGRMDCGFYQTFFQYVVGRDRDAHKFTLANALKDLTYLAGFANAARLANPISAAVRNAYAYAVQTGHENDYVPMLTDVIAASAEPKP